MICMLAVYYAYVCACNVSGCRLVLFTSFTFTPPWRKKANCLPYMQDDVVGARVDVPCTLFIIYSYHSLNYISTQKFRVNFCSFASIWAHSRSRSGFFSLYLSLTHMFKIFLYTHSKHTHTLPPFYCVHIIHVHASIVMFHISSKCL